MPIKDVTDFSNFDKLDIRAGKIIKVEDSLTKKPTYRLTIDFGPKKMGPEISEVLVLGVPNEEHETIYLTPVANTSPQTFYH